MKMITVIAGKPGTGKTNLMNTLIRNGNQCVEVFEEMTSKDLDRFKEIYPKLNRPVYITTQELTEQDFNNITDKLKWIHLEGAK